MGRRSTLCHVCISTWLRHHDSGVAVFLCRCCTSSARRLIQACSRARSSPCASSTCTFIHAVSTMIAHRWRCFCSSRRVTSSSVEKHAVYNATSARVHARMPPGKRSVLVSPATPSSPSATPMGAPPRRSAHQSARSGYLGCSTIWRRTRHHGGVQRWRRTRECTRWGRGCPSASQKR